MPFAKANIYYSGLSLLTRDLEICSKNAITNFKNAQATKASVRGVERESTVWGGPEKVLLEHLLFFCLSNFCEPPCTLGIVCFLWKPYFYFFLITS